MRELRIGRCACSSRYRGKLEGREVTVDGEAFRLREVFIPEDSGWKAALRRFRCHFFLDVHQLRRGYRTTLSLIQLIKNGLGRNEKLFMGGGIGPLYEKRVMEWEGKKPPKSKEIRRGIGKLIHYMSPGKRYQYLTYMTPPRRELPEAA